MRKVRQGPLPRRKDDPIVAALGYDPYREARPVERDPFFDNPANPPPDLPGQWVARDAVTDVVSQGNSRPHALAMLAEALALHAGEALPTGEPADGARTVDAVAREVVAWAATPEGLLAMMAHRGKQDLVALATAVLQRGALLAVLKAGELADRERVGEDEIVAEATPQDLENPAGG